MRGSVISILAVLTLLACSSSDSPKGSDGSGGSEQSGSGGSGTGGSGTGGSMGTGGTGTGGTGTGGMGNGGTGGRGCTPRTCKATDCGPLPDGCGALVDCGGCEGDAQCGIVTANECTDPQDLCIPLSESVACGNHECGVASDGCLGSYDCGTCSGDDVCGLFEPFKCGTPPPADPNDCPGKIDSCADVGAECGVIGNGCGGTLNCEAELGGCPVDTYCGLAGPQQCGAPLGCTPAAAADVCPGKCGQVSDNCGGLIDCSADPTYQCPSGQACGAGGVPNQCGAGTPNNCTPISQAAACGAFVCGRVSDGCGGAITCGTCSAGYACSVGTCQALCTPLTTAQACGSNECGLVGDGCGGQINCGTCTGGEQCGAQVAFQCDVPPGSSCTPLTPTQACAGRECGIALDGCGSAAINQIDCGTCASGEFCGIRAPFQCDTPTAPVCTPADSCAALGWECGTAIDSCGNTYNCAAEGRTCNALQTCTGGITGPATCTSGSGGTGGNCPLCGSIPNCSGQPQVTELTGRVRTPGQSDGSTANQVGVPNAFVYILQENNPARLPSIPTGYLDGSTPVTRCDRCDEQDLGPVLVSATTDARGEFTLRGNIPVGTQFTLVVKVGKWRRAQQITLPGTAACATSSLTFANTRLPRNRTDGLQVNIPRVAIMTGWVDAMECVFHKMGVASSEFVGPNGSASNAERIHLYSSTSDTSGSTVSYGAAPPGGSRVDDTDLLSSTTRVNGYDLLVFDCEGAEHGRSSTIDTRLRNYVNRGGRMFASHYSYVFIEGNGSAAYSAGSPLDTGLSGSATWGGGSAEDSGTGVVSVGRPGANPTRVVNFRDWLRNENVISPSGLTFSITDPRGYATSVGSSSEEWVYWDRSGNPVQQFSFNAPYGAPSSATCGRVAYSGFHVAGSGTFNGATFPNHCQGSGANNGNLTNQEKVLLYMLFDLGTCVSDGPPPPPVCTPLSNNDCSSNQCGILPDGCGGVVNCGLCEANQYCGADNTCIEVGCTPTTCGAQGATCGFIGDGCGNVLNCGTCQTGQVCGLLTPNQCTPVCTPTSYATACGAGVCGFVSDGCGGVHDCGSCTAGRTCTNNQCNENECTPITSCPANVECGLISDGCSDVLDCGTCTLPDVCGGGGVPNQCGRPQCDPLDCADLNAECGFIGDGCGGAVNCGPCPSGQTCGLGGPNRCGGCQPRSCAATGAECGQIGDGCGAAINCGTCPQGQVCGAMAPNRCGNGPNCTPLSCGAQGAECGLVGDGCGEAINCGTCPQGQVCGILSPNQCDPPPACSPMTCAAQGAECGALGDGCGNLLDCGPCPSSEACGVVAPNRCDGIQ